MKKLVIMAIASVLALSNVQASDTNVETCKTYIKEAKSFKETMKHTNIDEATLAFYKDNVVSYCGSIAAKMSYKKDFFAQQIMKKDVSTVSNCKLAINMAKTYVESGHTTPFIEHAHKLNVADNCGSLVAKKSPAFCLFDMVDNSKEDQKERCVASIQKAHSVAGTESLKTYKSEVVANCGTLQAHI